jgi:hypothetical protein
LLLVALLAQGCIAEPPRRSQQPDPSDPDARVPSVNYRSVLGADAGGRPVEPAPWTGQNNGGAAAPPKGGQ